MAIRYKVIIHDRKYTSWSYTPEEGFENCHKDEIEKITPMKHFSKDILLYDPSSNTIETFFSHIRSGTPLAGILVLEGNRTYGRSKKLLYKVIPDDNHLPVFLVPYDPPIGFSKVFKNKYVVFKFEHWNEEHPHGSLLSTIGETNSLESFYEYQLYCKSLHVSINHFMSMYGLKHSTFGNLSPIVSALSIYPIKNGLCYPLFSQIVFVVFKRTNRVSLWRWTSE